MITASEFTDDILNQDIQVKEGVALREILQMLISEAPNQLNVTNVVCNIDNQALQAIYNRKGTSKNLVLNNIGKQLYWLQEIGEFFLHLKYVDIKENKAKQVHKRKPHLGNQHKSRLLYQNMVQIGPLSMRTSRHPEAT